MDLESTHLALGQKPALILVDMITGFTDPACPLGHEADDVVAANIKLLAAMRTKGLPVIFTCVVYDTAEQGATFRAKTPALDLLNRGSHWTGIDPRLHQEASDWVIEKHHASAFFGTDLFAKLRQSGVDSLMITGLTTSGCVRATVVDALQHGFPTWVPREAVGDRNQAAHNANLFDLQATYAEVCTLEAALAALSAMP